MFKPKSILLQNFMSAKSIYHEFIKDVPIVLLEGEIVGNNSSQSNGAGKSTLIEGVVWVIYEKIIRSLNAKYAKDYVINDTVGKDCLVELVGFKDGVEFIIKRYRNHSKYGTGAELKIAGVNKEPRRNQDQNAMILEFFNIPFENFISSLVFTNKSTKFSQMTKGDRTIYFESFLPLQVYNDSRIIVKDRIKKHNDTITKLNFSLTEVTRSEADIGNKIIEAKNKSTDYEQGYKADIDSNRFIIENNKSELSKMKPKIQLESARTLKNNELLSLRTKVSNEILDITKYYDSLLSAQNMNYTTALQNINEIKNSKITKVRNDLDAKLNIMRTSISDKKKQLQSTYDAELLVKNNERTLINGVLSINTNEIKTKRASIASMDTAGICPTCHQTIDVTDIIKHKAELENEILLLEVLETTNKQKVESIDLEITTLKYKLEKDFSFIDSSDGVALALEQTELDVQLLDINTASDILAEKSKVEHEAIKLDLATNKDTKIKEVNDSNNKSAESIELTIKLLDDTIKKIDTLELAILNSENKIKVYDAGNPHVSVISSYENDIKLLGERRDLIKFVIDNRVKLIDRLKFWDTMFSNKGIKNYIVESLLPYMNEKAVEYSNMLTSSDIMVSFSNEDGLDVNVVSLSGGNVYAKCSDGERKRSDLIIQFALDDTRNLINKVDMDLRFYDEMFDSLDDYGIDTIIKTIKIMNHDKTVYLVSHNSGLSEKVDRSITIRKRNGFSELVEQEG